MIASCNRLQLNIPEETPIDTRTIQSSLASHNTIVVPESIYTLETNEPTISTPSISVQSDSSDVKINPDYFDGIIVLTRYYTLLDHGFYEEVLSLYSSNLLKKSRGKNFEADLKSVVIRFIYPYDYWLAKEGWPPKDIPTGEIRFVVGTTVYHKAAAWNIGGTPEPDHQLRFVSLVMEGEEWRLFEFNSSPWIH